MKLSFINGNGIKLLAAVLMVIDHIGMFFFPQAEWLRWIGRISLPLFAYMLAEGCRYTRNKFTHFSLLAIVALVCQIVSFIALGELKMSILVTFVLAELIIFSLSHFKKRLFCGGSLKEVILSAAAFAGMVFLTFALNCIEEINGIPFSIEYGFWGCMLPVFASIFDLKGTGARDAEVLDCKPLKLFSFLIGLLFLCLFHSNPAQWFCLIAIIPLALYNGERGRHKLKYFSIFFIPRISRCFMVFHC